MGNNRKWINGTAFNIMIELIIAYIKIVLYHNNNKNIII